MSNISKGQKRKKNINEDKTAYADREEMKEKLKFEIRLLKLFISQKMSSHTMSFKDIHIPQIGNVARPSQWNYNDLFDVEAEIKNDLYAMAGFRCKKMGNYFIFDFRSIENGLENIKNWIQLFKNGENWHLGKWVMPLSVDARAIFAKHTIDSAASMTLFLRECKHSLDCYYRREYEFSRLKAYLLDLGSRHISLQTNYAYTAITLNLVIIGHRSPGELHYVSLVLEYNKHEVRPCEWSLESEGENPLSEAEEKALVSLFKKFKDQSLKEVVEKVLTSDGSPFICKQDSQDNSIIDENAREDSDGETSFLKILKKQSNTKKKQQKIPSKNDENHNEVNGDEDRREIDLTIDTADESNTQSKNKSLSPVDILKAAKKKIKKAKTSKRKSLDEIETKVESQETTKPSKKIGKRSLLPKNRTDGDSIKTGQNVGKTPKWIVPENFKPKAKQTGFLEDINALDIELQKSAKKNKKIGNSGKKKSLPVQIRPLTPSICSRVRLKCSTPIVERPNNFSTVAAENISAIVKGNMTIASEITEIEKIQDGTVCNDSDESTSEKSDSKDITKFENSQKELLKDLQAVKDNVLVKNKTLKRKAKSRAKGKNKIVQK